MTGDEEDAIAFGEATAGGNGRGAANSIGAKTEAGGGAGGTWPAEGTAPASAKAGAGGDGADADAKTGAGTGAATGDGGGAGGDAAGGDAAGGDAAGGDAAGGPIAIAGMAGRPRAAWLASMMRAGTMAGGAGLAAEGGGLAGAAEGTTGARGCDARGGAGGGTFAPDASGFGAPSFGDLEKILIALSAQYQFHTRARFETVLALRDRVHIDDQSVIRAPIGPLLRWLRHLQRRRLASPASIAENAPS